MSKSDFSIFPERRCCLAGLVAMLIAAAPAEAAGFWRYAHTEIKPTQAELDANYHRAGSKTDFQDRCGVPGALRRARDGEPLLQDHQCRRKDLHFEGAVHLQDLERHLGARAWDRSRFHGHRADQQQFPWRLRLWKVAAGNADYTVDTSATVGKDGSGEDDARSRRRSWIVVLDLWLGLSRQ